MVMKYIVAEHLRFFTIYVGVDLLNVPRRYKYRHKEVKYPVGEF